MTTSLAYLLFEDENLKTNKPLPETSSDDFVINNALLKSLRNTLNDKLIAKLPEARKVKEAIDSLQTKDDMSDAEKSNLVNDVKPIINDPIGAFSKGDLIRLSNTAQNISRIGPVVFDVAQMKTGKSQIKGFTGIDLELMKQSQIIPLMVMTKEGKVLSGDNTSKGEFGIIFLAPAYYAKINPENVPIYEKLFPGILSKIKEGGETMQIASNNIDNVTLPAAPFNSDTEKIIQNAFKNRKTLPALINRLETAYRSTKQNIDFDVSDDVSKADQQAIDLQAAGVFENSSMICKQGVSSLLIIQEDTDSPPVEDESLDNIRLTILKSIKGGDFDNAIKVYDQNKALFDDTEEEHYETADKWNYDSPYYFDLKKINPSDSKLLQKLIEKKITETLGESAEGKKLLKNKSNENIFTFMFKGILSGFKTRRLFNRFLKDLKRSGNELESSGQHYIVAGFIVDFLLSANIDEFKKLFESKYSNKSLIKEISMTGAVSLFKASYGPEILVLLIFYNIYKMLFGPKHRDILNYICLYMLTEKNNISWRKSGVFKKFITDIYDSAKEIGEEGEGDQEGDQGGEGEGEDQEQGEQGEEKKEVDYKDFDDKFNTELDKALSKAKLEIEKYDDIQKEKEIKYDNSRPAEIRNWLRFAGQKAKSDEIYDRLTEIDPELTDDIRGVSLDRETTKEKSFDDVGKILLVNIAALYDLIVKGLKIEIPSSEAFSNTIERYSQLQNLIDRDKYEGEEKEDLEGLIERDLEELFSKDSNFLFTDKIVNNIDDGETKKIFLSKTKEVRDKFVNLYTRSLNTSTQSVTIKSIQETPPYIAYLAKKLDMSPRKIFSNYLREEHPQTIAMFMTCIQPVFGLEKAYNSFIMGYYDLPIDTQVEVAVRYASLDVVDTDILQQTIITIAKTIAKNKKLNVEITKEELDKFGEDCKVIYGVPVEEEEVRDEHINDICEYMQRKIIQESDRERYEKAVAKAAADFKAKQTTQTNIEMAGFSLGGLTSLALGASAGIATGGIGAAVPLIAGIIGCPIAAVGAGVTTELLTQLFRGKPKQKEVTQSNLEAEVKRKAKQSSNTLKRIILNQVKAATVVENVYVHLKNNSLAQLIFEEADFDFTDSGTDVKRSNTKKRQIERKSLEAMFEQKKFLVYDKSLEETNLDILGLKNEFIESLNSILDYYYNTTIVGVVSKKSAFETIKSVKIENAISEKVEAIGQEATAIAVIEAAAESVRVANPDVSDDAVQAQTLKVYSTIRAATVIKSKDYEAAIQKANFGSKSSEENPSTRATSSDDSPEVSTFSADETSETNVSNAINITDLKLQNTHMGYLNSKNVKFVKAHDDFVVRNSMNRKIIMPVFKLHKNQGNFLIGYINNNEFYCMDDKLEILKFNNINAKEDNLKFAIKEISNFAIYANSVIASLVPEESINDDQYKAAIKGFLENFTNENNEAKKKLLEKFFNKEADLYLFESKANKKSNSYLTGSLTNLLFESDLKRSKDFYNKSKNKKQELSNLREEWLNIWDIYK